MIAIVGSIQTRSWDGQDGKKQYATEVVVDEAHFTGSKNDAAKSGDTNTSAENTSGFDTIEPDDEDDLPF